MQYRLAPHWHNHHCLRRQALPAGLLDWLLFPGSMTARQEVTHQRPVVVRVIKHQWQKPRLSECHALGLRPGELAMVREVDLLCAGQPYMFARSIFPAQTTVGCGRRLRNLGAQPLGKFMFAIPTFSRQPFDIAVLRSGHADFQRAAQLLNGSTPDQLWARRSVCYLTAKQPLLVSEIFLPCLYQHAN